MRIGAIWEDQEPTWLIGFDLDWPGTLGTF